MGYFRDLVPRRDPNAPPQRTLLEAMKTVTFIQWALFFSGWLAWTCDALDFFSVSLSVPRLEEQFDKSASQVTQSITLTLLFRSLGAVIFGFISDRFGRRWPLVANLLLCAVLQLATGFVQTFPQFLALRSLFGIAMGGVWGMASSTALENLPIEMRGLASGIIQQGYAMGYLIGAVINLFLVPNTKETWRSLFWCAAGISVFGAVVRAVLPESEVFLRAKAAARTQGEVEKTKTFIIETKKMFRLHWRLCIYAVLLMSGFNFLSHGSQDLYPTYLQTTKGLSPNLSTKATIIANCGAITGGATAGMVSQWVGRRLTIVTCVLLVAAFIPLWILPSTFSPLSAGAFWVQFGVQGAWGVVPIHLSELSPPAFRATFAGVSYQLGNMVSSASAQIEATGGEHQRTVIVRPNGERADVPDYATVQGIFIGCVAAFLVVVTLAGKENHSSHFEKHKVAFEQGGGEDDAYFEGDSDKGSVESSSIAGEKRQEVREQPHV